MDESPTPVGGFRMVIALTDLAEPQQEPLVAEYPKSLPVLEWSWLEDARSGLWSGLLSQACRGEIEFRGVRDGDTEPRVIHPGLLRGSKPDLLADTLVAAGITWHSVAVFRASDMVPASVQASHPAIVSPAHRCAYSEEALSAWFVLRVRSLPTNTSPPNAQADMSDAALFFDSLPSREEFRRIRANKTPREWRKTGPRGAR